MGPPYRPTSVGTPLALVPVPVKMSTLMREQSLWCAFRTRSPNMSSSTSGVPTELAAASISFSDSLKDCRYVDHPSTAGTGWSVVNSLSSTSEPSWTASAWAPENSTSHAAFFPRPASAWMREAATASLLYWRTNCSSNVWLSAALTAASVSRAIYGFLSELTEQGSAQTFGDGGAIERTARRAWGGRLCARPITGAGGTAGWQVQLRVLRLEPLSQAKGEIELVVGVGTEED